MSERAISVTVVDDNADITQMMRLRLGMEPDIACEGFTDVEQAAQRLTTAPADGRAHVILLDWSIPGWTGDDAVRRIAAAAPRARIVVFSGYDEAQIGSAAFDAGAWRCLSKHAELAEVMRVIREVAHAGALKR